MMKAYEMLGTTKIYFWKGSTYSQNSANDPLSSPLDTKKVCNSIGCSRVNAMIGGKECPECSEKGFACIRKQREKSEYEIGRSIKGGGKRGWNNTQSTTMALTVERQLVILLSIF